MRVLYYSIKGKCKLVSFFLKKSGVDDYATVILYKFDVTDELDFFSGV